MDATQKDIENYLNSKKELIGATNYTLLKEYANKHQGTTTEPTAARTINVLIRLVSICSMLKNKPLDTLTENDLITLNKTMNERQMKSTKDYRSILKQFFRLKDKRKYFDLIDSDYFKNRRTKKQLKVKMVDPRSFWTPEQLNEYMKASKKFSNEHIAFISLLFSCGLRPCEALALTKSSIEYQTEPRKVLIVNVPAAKTEPRTIPLYNGEAEAVHNYLKPHIETLKENELIFKKTYNAYRKTHLILCKKINLPEDKMRKLYVARKMALTRFYRTYDTPKAEAMAGHEHGSGSVAHYIGISKEDLVNDSLRNIEVKRCPNSKCGHINEPHFENCVKCSSPLDPEKFRKIFQESINNFAKEYIDAQIQLKIQQLK